MHREISAPPSLAHRPLASLLAGDLAAYRDARLRWRLRSRRDLSEPRSMCNAIIGAVGSDRARGYRLRLQRSRNGPPDVIG